MASDELKKLGGMSYGEKVLGATFVVLLLLWTVGDLVLGISATTTAFVGVIILMVFQVLTWEDIIREKAAWDTMTWFAVLYMMATALSAYGFIDWVSEVIMRLPRRAALANGTDFAGHHLLLRTLLLRFGYRTHFRNVHRVPGRRVGIGRTATVGRAGPGLLLQHFPVTHPLRGRCIPNSVRHEVQLHRAVVGRGPCHAALCR